MPKVVNSWNEWDLLKRVIVGRPEGTNVPALCCFTIGVIFVEAFLWRIWGRISEMTAYRHSTGCRGVETV